MQRYYNLKGEQNKSKKTAINLPIQKRCLTFALANQGYLGRVARQRSAKPCTAVRIRQVPQHRRHCCLLFVLFLSTSIKKSKKPHYRKGACLHLQSYEEASLSQRCIPLTKLSSLTNFPSASYSMKVPLQRSFSKVPSIRVPSGRTTLPRPSLSPSL